MQKGSEWNIPLPRTRTEQHFCEQVIAPLQKLVIDCNQQKCIISEQLVLYLDRIYYQSDSCASYYINIATIIASYMHGSGIPVNRF